jgi:hypothetical protein
MRGSVAAERQLCARTCFLSLSPLCDDHVANSHAHNRVTTPRTATPTLGQRRPRPRQGDEQTDTLTSANVIFSSKHFFTLLSISVWNCRERGCPSRRGWTIYPARAPPSWIIRGACPLHNLMEVKKEEVKNEEEAMKGHIMHLASATSILPPTLPPNKGISPPTPSRA